MSNILRPWKIDLRPWQLDAFGTYRSLSQRDFLLVATPGSGKTLAALRIAHWLMESGIVSRLVVVVPSSHLRRQWAEAAHKAGIDLDPTWENRDGYETGDFHGIVVTYQSVASMPLLYRRSSSERPTLVILDEIHHAGHDLGWGQAVSEAFQLASRRLALSGTPFRSDPSLIPFVRYEDGLSRPDFPFSYEAALKTGEVVRAILFPHHEGEMEWLDNGESMVASFADELDEAGVSKRLRTALLPSGEWLRDIISEANNKLLEIRQGHPDAGGLILAMDQTHARRVADLMRSLADDPQLPPAARSLLRDPLVVTSDDPSASDKITAFREDSRPWVVAVRMISEGVDIPRLRLGIYASAIVTELFFRQVVGRLVRWIKGIKEQTAYLYIPADARLVAFARDVQDERNHFIDETAKADSLDKPATPEEREPSLGMFLPVNASAAVSQGIIHESSVIPPAELAEARGILGDVVASLVPENVLVDALRRLKAHFAATQPAPVTQPHEDQPAEQMKFQARNAARALKDQRARTFASFILKASGRPYTGYQDAIQLVNRKLAEYTGAYAQEATTAQLRQQQKLLLRWSAELGKTVKERCSLAWLQRWEESKP